MIIWEMSYAGLLNWKPPIIRDSLTIPLMTGEPGPQRKVLSDEWNRRYRDYCWAAKCATVAINPHHSWTLLGPPMHSHFIMDKNHPTSILIWLNRRFIHPLVLSFSHYSVKYQHWPVIISFIPSDRLFHLALHTTVAFFTEVTTHLRPNPKTFPSLSREKHRSIPSIVAKQRLNEKLPLRKSHFVTTLTLTIRFTFQKYNQIIFELNYFPSSNAETDDIDFVIWFTPSMLLRIQSISQNYKLLLSQLLPEFGNHWLSESRRCP
jgi:hypothetical protein